MLFYLIVIGGCCSLIVLLILILSILKTNHIPPITITPEVPDVVGPVVEITPNQPLLIIDTPVWSGVPNKTQSL